MSDDNRGKKLRAKSSRFLLDDAGDSKKSQRCSKCASLELQIQSLRIEKDDLKQQLKKKGEEAELREEVRRLQENLRSVRRRERKLLDSLKAANLRGREMRLKLKELIEENGGLKKHCERQEQSIENMEKMVRSLSGTNFLDPQLRAKIFVEKHLRKEEASAENDSNSDDNEEVEKQDRLAMLKQAAENAGIVGK